MKCRDLMSAAIRGGLTGLVCLAACLPCDAQNASSGAGGRSPSAAPKAAATPAAKPVTAYPKGHYTSLNSLPDWGGVWVLNFNRPPPGAQPQRPALQGQYLKDYEAWRDAVKANGGEVPHEGSYCTPPGMPGIMSVGQYPIEFLFTPGRVTVHHEAWMQSRSIYTDGRGHPDDLEATFQGDSIGHWQGTTLVIDTVGVKTAAAMGQGMKHSPGMRITERIHLAPKDPDTLVDEMTIEDPEALAKPWTRALTYKRSRDLQLLEFECAENDRNPVDSAGKTGFRRQ